MKASRETIQEILDSLPELAWSARPDGYVDVYNRRWYDYTGAAPADMEGWGWTSVHDPALVASVKERWAASIATGQGFDMEFPLRGKDGLFRWFLTRARPARDEAGRVVRWFGTSADVDAPRFLSTASELLATSLDVHRTLEEVAALAVPRMADWCAVDLVEEDGSFTRAAIAHVDPKKVELAREMWRQMPPRPGDAHGVAHVVSTGTPEIVPEITDEALAEMVTDPHVLATVRALGLRSSMCIPLAARDHVLGAISLVTSESNRLYGPIDVELARELARRAAMAIDNARLFRAMEDAKNRAEFLADDVAEQCRAMDRALQEERARRAQVEERLATLERRSARPSARPDPND